MSQSRHLNLLSSKKIGLIAITVSAVDAVGMNINIWHVSSKVKVNLDHAHSAFVSKDASNLGGNKSVQRSAEHVFPTDLKPTVCVCNQCPPVFFRSLLCVGSDKHGKVHLAKHPLLVQCNVTTVGHDALIDQQCRLWACLQGRDESLDDFDTVFITPIVEALPQKVGTNSCRWRLCCKKIMPLEGDPG